MQQKGDRKNSRDLPAQLFRSPPRRVEPNQAGMILLAWAAILVGAAVWTGLSFYPHARTHWSMLFIPPALVFAAAVLMFLFRQQSRLLSEGRVALATVTRSDKVVVKGSTTWRVHYEWILLSGAKRRGHYKSAAKQPPSPGTQVPIVYDRDQPLKNAKYPMPLVRLKP